MRNMTYGVGRNSTQWCKSCVRMHSNCTGTCTHKTTCTFHVSQSSWVFHFTGKLTLTLQWNYTSTNSCFYGFCDLVVGTHTLSHTSSIYTCVLSLYKNIYIHTLIPLMILVTWFCTFCDSNHTATFNCPGSKPANLNSDWYNVRNDEPLQFGGSIFYPKAEKFEFYLNHLHIISSCILNTSPVHCSAKVLLRNGLLNAFAPCLNLTTFSSLTLSASVLHQVTSHVQSQVMLI